MYKKVKVMKDKVKVIMADDNPLVLEGVNLMLSKRDDIIVLDKCNDGLELVENNNLSFADLLLVDIDMPRMNGIEAAIRVNYKFPHLPMIAITMHKEKVYLNEIVSAGFKAFIHKPEISKELFHVIDQVLNKEFVFPNNLQII